MSLKVVFFLCVSILLQACATSHSSRMPSAVADVEYFSAANEVTRLGIGKVGITPSGTGIRISNTRRIILTNQHNLALCFSQGTPYQKYGISVVDLRATDECVVNQAIMDPLAYPGKGRILGYGVKGKILPDERNVRKVLSNMDVYLKLVDEGFHITEWGSSRDFAIVEVDDTFGSEGRTKWSDKACLVAKTVDGRSPVKTIGFPFLQRSKPPKLYEPMQSTGRIITDPSLKREFAMTFIQSVGLEPSDDVVDLMLRFNFEDALDRVYLSDVDSAPGASGSPILQNGALVGLIFAGDPLRRKVYAPATSLFINVSYIRAILAADGLPEKEWFNCQ